MSKFLMMNLPSQPVTNRHKRRQFLLLAACLLVITTLGCALGGPMSGVNRVVILTRLPTLTRTPLPTLTPTALATPVAIAAAAQPVAVAGVENASPDNPAPPLNPTLPPPSSDLAAAMPAAIPVNTQPSLTALVNLNVRAGPSVDYPILGKLVPDQSFQIVGKNPEGTWWQIVYPPGSGSIAWVSADAQYSTANSVEAVQIAQLPPPPPPTATPTPSPTVPPTPIPTQPVVPAGPLTATPSTATPSPDDTPGAKPAATPASDSPGWAFASVHLYPDYENGLLLYGNVVNNTGALQKLESISGAFFDAQGEEVSDEDNIYGYWPVDEIPSGASIPFELMVEDVNDIANFKLSAEAEPGDHNPRQDFEFSDVKQWTEADTFCINGEIHIPDDLEDYLVIAAILYDEQDNVIKFGDYGVFSSGDEIDDGKSDFEICVDSPNQDAARYELRAWGS